MVLLTNYTLLVEFMPIPTVAAIFLVWPAVVSNTRVLPSFISRPSSPISPIPWFPRPFPSSLPSASFPSLPHLIPSFLPSFPPSLPPFFPLSPSPGWSRYLASEVLQHPHSPPSQPWSHQTVIVPSLTYRARLWTFRGKDTANLSCIFSI